MQQRERFDFDLNVMRRSNNWLQELNIYYFIFNLPERYDDVNVNVTEWDQKLEGPHKLQFVIHKRVDSVENNQLHF